MDILLRDSKNNTLYEVEVMLGETDPSHIIRTIEYWDIERRIYPQRQHFAVLVAESFSRRYFNVIQLLSQTIPIIAVQADLIEFDNELVLNFTKIMDMYLPLEEGDSEETNVSQWEKKANWIVETVNEFVSILATKYPEQTITPTYTQSYIRVAIDNQQYFFHKRVTPNVFVEIYAKDEEKRVLIATLLDKRKVDYTFNNYQAFTFTTTKKFIQNNKDIFLEIHDIKTRELNDIEDE